MGLGIVYLCKVFEEESHARNFCAGNIRVTQLREFSRIEDAVSPRFDRHEGASVVFRAGDGKLCVKPPHGDCVEVTPKNQEMSFHAADEDRYILCMYAGVLEHGRQFSPQEIQRCLRPHPWCSKFGNWVVVLKERKEFLERLERAALDAQCKVVGHRLVEYYDWSCTQIFEPTDVPFHKEQSYSWQSEYRVAFASGGDDKRFKELKIGDISDITHIFTLAEFTSASYSVTWKSDSMRHH